MGGIEDHTGLDDQVRSSPDDEERSDPKKLIAPGSEKSEMDDKIMLGGDQEQYRDYNLPSVQNNNISNAENRILQTPNSRTRRVMEKLATRKCSSATVQEFRRQDINIY